MIIPGQEADRIETCIGHCMIALSNAKERSEREWAGLPEFAGFRVRKFWRSRMAPRAHEGVVEAVLV